jgi:hypothetical protein
MKKTTLHLFLLVLLALPLGAQSLPEDVLREEEGTDAPMLSEEDEAALAVEAPPLAEDYAPAPAPVVEERSLSPEKWKEVVGDIDYSKDVKEVKKEKPKDKSGPGGPSFSGRDWTSLTRDMGVFFQWLVVLLAVIGIAYGLYHSLQGPRNRRLASDGTEITLDNVEDYLHESDLDRFLREALAAGNYNLAVRLYYLQVIKSLSEKKLIAWAKEKTNREYVSSLQAHTLGESFRDLTRRYERVWYGNETLDGDKYTDLELRFKSLLRRI